VYLRLLDNLVDRSQQVTESNDKNKAVIILILKETKIGSQKQRYDGSDR